MENYHPHQLGWGNQKMVTKLGSITCFDPINEFQKGFEFRQNVFKRIQRLCFCQRTQLPGETFVSFASALWELALHCDFGPLQDELVLDQLIEKARDWRIRETLFTQINSLTLSRAIELGSQMETAFKAAPTRISSAVDQWTRQIISSRNWRMKYFQHYGKLQQRTGIGVLSQWSHGTKCCLIKKTFHNCHSAMQFRASSKLVCF